MADICRLCNHSASSCLRNLACSGLAAKHWWIQIPRTIVGRPSTMNNHYSASHMRTGRLTSHISCIKIIYWYFHYYDCNVFGISEAAQLHVPDQAWHLHMRRKAPKGKRCSARTLPAIPSIPQDHRERAEELLGVLQTPAHTLYGWSKETTHTTPWHLRDPFPLAIHLGVTDPYSILLFLHTSSTATMPHITGSFQVQPRLISKNN